MNNFDYDSDEWRMEREEAIEQAHNTCERCGIYRNKWLHVHHVYGTSRGIYQVLCPQCHAEIHGKDEILEFDRDDLPENVSYCKECGNELEWHFVKEKNKELPFSFNEKTKLYELHRCKIQRCKFCNAEIEWNNNNSEQKWIPYDRKTNIRHNCKQSFKKTTKKSTNKLLKFTGENK